MTSAGRGLSRFGSCPQGTEGNFYDLSSYYVSDIVLSTVKRCLMIGHILKNVSLGNFVVLTSYSECTYTNLDGIDYYTPKVYNIIPGL